MNLGKKKLVLFASGSLLASDVIVVVISFLFSHWLRFHSHLFPTRLGIPAYRDYFPPLIFIVILLSSIFSIRGLYRFDPAQKFIDQLFRILKSVGSTILLVLAGTFFYREVSYSRSLILVMGVVMALFLVLSRYLLRQVHKKKILPRVRKKIILIGKPQEVDAFAQYKKYFNYYGDIVGFVSSRRHGPHEAQSLPCLGTLDEFGAILSRENPEEIILTELGIPRRQIMGLILEAEKRLVAFKIVADLLDIMIQQFEIEHIDGINLVKIKESPLTCAYNRIMKRTLDLTGSFFGLVFLSPLFLVVSFIIKCTSPGPIFFSQERISEGGRSFKLYKFRTMCDDAEKKTGPVFTQKDDDRCTPVGRFLRRTNIDELPQLWNVLKGEMSLVGPRPERPHFVDQFKDDIPRYMSRHHVKSGMTGWAQVNGLRQDTPIEERIKYDLFYLENWSIWSDLKIIVLTFFALKNAY